MEALFAGWMCGLPLAASVAPAQPAIQQQPVQFNKDDYWWVGVNVREFYLIPDALIEGG